MNTATDWLPLLQEDPVLAQDDTSATNRSEKPPALPAEDVLRNRAPEDVLACPKIMIVDDEPINVKVVRKYLCLEGYDNFVTTTEPAEAIPLITKQSPDIVLLDIMMPEISGLEILETLRNDERFVDLPILILTAAGDRQTKVEALSLGATDFLTKPVDPLDLMPRIRNALSAKAYHDNLKRYAWQLELEVSLRTGQLEKAHEEVVHCLARAAEFRDDDTGNHVMRVAQFSAAVGHALELPEDRVNLLKHAATLHDIGKIGIPDSILLKPGKLDEHEFAAVQMHCTYGHDIVGNAGERQIALLKQHTDVGARILKEGFSPVLRLAAKIALTHHERWDGTGYPLGLKGEDIPLEGRIVAVSDVFDALCNKRPYKPAFPLDECFEMIAAGRGTQFDPRVVDTFHDIRDEIVRIRTRYADTRQHTPVIE